MLVEVTPQKFQFCQIILLENATVDDAVGSEVASAANSFALITPRKSLLLTCTSHAKMRDWVSALRTVIDELKRSNQSAAFAPF